MRVGVALPFGLTLSLSKGEAAAPSVPISSILRQAQDEDIRGKVTLA